MISSSRASSSLISTRTCHFFVRSPGAAAQLDGHVAGKNDLAHEPTPTGPSISIAALAFTSGLALEA